MSENNTPNFDAFSPIVFPMDLPTAGGSNQTSSSAVGGGSSSLGLNTSSNFLTPSVFETNVRVGVNQTSSIKPIRAVGLDAFNNDTSSVPISNEESPQIFTPGITAELLNTQTPRIQLLPPTPTPNETPFATKIDNLYPQQVDPLSNFDFGQKNHRPVGAANIVTQYPANTFNMHVMKGFFIDPSQVAAVPQGMPQIPGPSSDSPSSPTGECLPTGTLLSVIRGFSIDDGVPEEPGGRDNKKPLTSHTVQVRIADLVAEHPLGPNQTYVIKCVLLGYKRYEKEELSTLESIPIENIDNPAEYEEFVFNNLIVKQTSHSNGQKLFLRFKLEINSDSGEQVLEALDTTHFKTVTKRAVIKRGVTRKLSEQKKTATVLTGAEPKYSVTSGGQLIKLVTNNMPEKVRVQTIVVKFGEKKARRVHSARDNVIICETPEYPKSDNVPISVSLDSGATFFHSSGVKMSFIDPTDGLPDITPHSQTFVVNFAQAASDLKHDRDEDTEPNNKKKSKK
ncbi:IPT domain-containing protein [Naegleria gruberi]|uniref:IPT domain-containing protein n=1 Tax=Naegleria gruberi TaxID=5762 RepID=D2V8S9_NAEGR|nr:IPT domain-containing protein [Naegleria gruberi]EFC46743.1 IPT domain-containing protein [Naegleria gruberi]|eukprot:XP_002679487.1 IPT domain-containing protein [Naegleria gruberi strain NEG-M]